MIFGRLLLVAIVALAGCDGPGETDDAGDGVDSGNPLAGPHLAMGWQMRCVEGTCPPADAPARMLDHDHGQDGVEVRCDLQFDGTTRRMDITVRDPAGTGHGFEIRGAQIAEDGGRLMGSFCQIRVFEPDDVDLLTQCSSNSPTADTACQISRIDIRDVLGVPTLLGELRCDGAPAEASRSQVRDVTSATSASGNAAFTFTGCAGL